MNPLTVPHIWKTTTDIHIPEQPSASTQELSRDSTDSNITPKSRDIGTFLIF